MKILRIAAVLCGIAFSLPISRPLAAPADDGFASCRSAMPATQEASPWSAELARYEQLPTDCLKTMFMHCSAESERRALGSGEVMVCSFGYEALLKGAFRGDFDALLGWWRLEKAAVPQAN
jgi:hypothetical protein